MSFWNFLLTGQQNCKVDSTIKYDKVFFETLTVWLVGEKKKSHGMIYIQVHKSQTILYVLCPRNDCSSIVRSVLTQMAHLDSETCLCVTLHLSRANQPLMAPSSQEGFLRNQSVYNWSLRWTAVCSGWKCRTCSGGHHCLRWRFHSWIDKVGGYFKPEGHFQLELKGLLKKVLCIYLGGFETHKKNALGLD